MRAKSIVGVIVALDKLGQSWGKVVLKMRGKSQKKLRHRSGHCQVKNASISGLR